MKERRCHLNAYGLYWWNAEEKSQLFFLYVGYRVMMFPQRKTLCKCYLSILDAQHLFK
jgi:hypothetical protein